MWKRMTVLPSVILKILYSCDFLKNFRLFFVASTNPRALFLLLQEKRILIFYSFTPPF